MGIRCVRGARVGLLVLLLIASAACTDDVPAAVEAPEASPPAPAPAPAAPTGVRVGVVLPPTSESDAGVPAAIDAQLTRLASTSDDTVRELLGYAAADPRFVEDVARWLTERGTELVCVLGDRAEDVVLDVAMLYPAGRFCALPAGRPSPDEAGATPDSDGILRVDLRVEELGHLVGVAARIQGRQAPVGLVLGGDELPDPRFREGLLAGLAGATVVEADVASDQDASLEERAEAVLAAGAEVVVVDGGVGASEAVAAIGDRAEVLAPSAVRPEAADTDVSLRWNVRWDRALAGPLDAMAGATTRGQHTSVGLVDEVFEILPGDGMPDAARVALEGASDGLIAGTLDPSMPAAADPDTGADDPEGRGSERRAPDPGGTEPADPEPVPLVS